MTETKDEQRWWIQAHFWDRADIPEMGPFTKDKAQKNMRDLESQYSNGTFVLVEKDG